MATPTKKDEMIITIDSNPNERITAPIDTLFWRHNSTFYLIHPITNEMSKIDVPIIRDKKYDTPFYKNYKFVYQYPDETWIKTTRDNVNTGWQFLRYSQPTLGTQQGTPIPPGPTPTLPPGPTPTPYGPSPIYSGSFTGSFYGSFTGSFFVENTYNCPMTGTFYFITGSGGSSSFLGYIGLPTDGYYGLGPNGNAAGLQDGDLLEDAFDKLDTVLDKLVPPRPPGLGTKLLTMVGGYSARFEGTNTLGFGVTTSPSPIFQLSDTSAANSFFDAESGTLSALLDGGTVGTRSLTTSSDVGTYESLKITYDDDYYIGQIGKQGFWYSLMASIDLSADPVNTAGSHSVELTHTKTGNTNVVNFYIDDAVTPTNIIGSVTASGISYISGVPALVGGSNGASIIFTSSADNTVGRFYNNSRIFSFGGTGISTTSSPLPDSPLSGSTQSVSGSVLVNGGSVTENASFVITAYNSANVANSYIISNTEIRMDSTLDNRISSGIGQYPISYGSSFDNTQDLTTVGNEELQLLNGKYQYPTGNYTSAVPISGPDYSGVVGGTWNNMRWVTFDLGLSNNFKNVQLTFNNSNNFDGGGLPMSNFALFVRVDGSTPTVGWVDGNSAYGGIGDPTNNGDSALAVNTNASANVRTVTFGTQIKTGNIIVRVGIPSGNNRKFSSITKTIV